MTLTPNLITQINASLSIHRVLIAALLSCCSWFVCDSVLAEAPSVAYIFPAGGQRGQTVNVRVGGHFLYEAAPFRMLGDGVEASSPITRTKTTWFEGPVIPQPGSQRKEDYPKDYAGQIKIAKHASLGGRMWHVWTSQGVTPGMRFVVGELPEIVEEEIDGKVIPVDVKLPVTINGRIFPREDVDTWRFHLEAGQVVTAEVNAARIGSALDSRLELHGPNGTRIAENLDTFGKDSFVSFTAKQRGTYSVSIHDVEFGGLQHYVYRLTLRTGPYVKSVYPLGGRRGTKLDVELVGPGLDNQKSVDASARSISVPVDSPTQLQHTFHIGQASDQVVLEVDDLPEVLEPSGSEATSFQAPCVLNGRISQPGEVDRWKFDATKGDKLVLEVRAGRLGSLLDSVLQVLDADGKVVAQNDDAGGGVADSKATFNAPADGTYTIEIRDRFDSRGGLEFAYRVRVAEPVAAKPDFRIHLPADTITAERGKDVKIKVDLERLGGFQEEVKLTIEGLPEGVEVKGDTIAAKKPNTQLTLKAADTVKIGLSKLRITGTGIIPPPKPAKGKGKANQPADPQPMGKTITSLAMVKPAQPNDPPRSEIWLHVSMPTPFKFWGDFETRYASRGSVYVRTYHLDRGDFEGPIEVTMADRQARHLQGVTGPKVTLGPEVKDTFDYNVTLAPYMQIGRTSRSCIALIGVVKDADGSKHKVSFSSQTQDDQIIVLVDPTQIGVRCSPKSLLATPGTTARVRVDVQRGSGLTGPVELQLVIADHIRGVDAKNIIVPADASHGEFEIRFAKDSLGPFNMPLTARAKTMDSRGFPVIGESVLDVISEQ